MIDLDELRQRFPGYTIRSQPDPSCSCNGGVRTVSSGNECPCLCVCLSAPKEGEDEYRADLGRALGRAAQRAAREMGE